jgi:hypothetical protein
MSWHCICENSTDSTKPWVHIHVAPIDGGVPITIIMHTECLRKAICEDKEGNLIEGIDNVNESLEMLRDDAQEILDKERDQEAKP